ESLEVLPQITNDYEVIVVNDGSSDGTAAVLDGLAYKFPCLRAIHHPRNRGYGGALRRGLQSATQNPVLFTHGGGEKHLPGIMKLIPLMAEDVDVVNGYKIKRSDSRRRILLGGVYKFLARRMFGLPISDVDCDFRLMRREAIQSVTLTSTSGVVCTEMVYKLHAAGYRFAETPVHHYRRLHGQSQFFTLRRVARTGYDFFKLWLKLVIGPRSIFSAEEKSKAAAETTSA